MTVLCISTTGMETKWICVVDGFTIWEMKISGLSIQLRNSENVHLNKFKKEQEEENKNESRGK